MIDIVSAGFFVMAALALLGSPGPAIAALLATGRLHGMATGLRFYLGLQIGLAIAAAAAAAGLLSLIEAIPLAMLVMTVAASLYLVWLSWKIASAPVGADLSVARRETSPTLAGGVVLGLTNPKAYIAFASLFAAYRLSQDGALDMQAKWALCVLVMIVVDIFWLWLGVALGKAKLEQSSERALNICFGLVILATAIVSLVELVGT
ncbi:threonine/homoserine/homoserine lactone efflux protein [Rhizobium sp. BK196]|uniref:LysE family translocator n=1 Tax=Rhizobium sp. BK196 TaxID=2587073 RepID=UPI0016185293|nr:LysE family transporter [Rhizobium sp. BK196]MBB3311190.1 threonine/homoserine/homoserine lactone efflux protein [Rhizobium sp. BK196]